MSKPSIEQYQGQPTLCLNPEARYKFSFGVAKAKMILDHLAEIQAFVASEGTSVASSNSTSDSTFYSGGTYPVRGESSADKSERERTTKRNSLSFDAAPTDGVNLDILRRNVF